MCVLNLYEKKKWYVFILNAIYIKKLFQLIFLCLQICMTFFFFETSEKKKVLLELECVKKLLKTQHVLASRSVNIS